MQFVLILQEKRSAAALNPIVLYLRQQFATCYVRYRQVCRRDEVVRFLLTVHANARRTRFQRLP